jgi:hypothetical protein
LPRRLSTVPANVQSNVLKSFTASMRALCRRDRPILRAQPGCFRLDARHVYCRFLRYGVAQFGGRLRRDSAEPRGGEFLGRDCLGERSWLYPKRDYRSRTPARSVVVDAVRLRRTRIIGAQAHHHPRTLGRLGFRCPVGRGFAELLQRRPSFFQSRELRTRIDRAGEIVARLDVVARFSERHS